MTRTNSTRHSTTRQGPAPTRTTLVVVAAAGLGATLVIAAAQSAWAAEAPVGLGAAQSFAVLAGSTVTNTGASVVSGDLGVSPGTAITGFPPGLVIAGAQHSADAVALQAQADLTIAYNDAAGRTPATSVASELGGRTLVGGVYAASSGLALTGTVTLDAKGDPNTVFVFQAGSTLITASNSTVALINGTQACNVYWQVGSSATVGTDSDFAGTVMALTTITLQTNTTVNGRVLARNGAVNLDDNTITRPFCATTPADTEAGTPTTATPGTPTAAAKATPAPATPGTPTGPAAATPGAGGAPGTGPGDSSTSVVPFGRPDTGRGADAPMGAGPAWLALGSVALVGSLLAGRPWLRRPSRGRHL